MAGKMLLTALLGLIGVTVPFILASRILNLFYAPTVAGTGPPMGAGIAGFGAATLIAALAFYITIQFTKRLQSGAAEDYSIEEPEELPE